MNLLESLEIYIPGDAEVKSILLWSLPNSVLRRMGLPLLNTDGSRKLAESPEGIWICPAVIRRKGQKPASHAGTSVIENMSALMGRECRATPGPFRMSFVSSNRAAHKVLKDTMPGTKVSVYKPNMSTPEKAPRTQEDAVVIYQGQIFLSIRNPSRSQSRQERHKPQSSIPSTSVSSNSHKRQSPQASLEPANKELQRKKLCTTLPKISPKLSEGLLPRADSHSNRAQELPNENNTKEKHTTCKVTHSEARKDVAHKVRDASSSKPVHSVPQSPDSVHKEKSNSHTDARGEQAAEAAGLQLSLCQPQSEQEEMAIHDSEIQDLSSEQARSINKNSDMDCNIKNDGGGPEKTVGSFEHNMNQSWTRTECQGAAFASTSLQQGVDFKDLAREDRIAQLKAKIRQKEANFNNLQSS